jgi:septum formation protein
MPAALILASACPSRRQLLGNADLSFKIEPSGVDEDEVTRSLLGEQASPQDIATTLAEMKAVRVSSRHPIAGDQRGLDAGCNGRLFDKPATLDAARQRLLALAGNASFCSSVVVAGGGVLSGTGASGASHHAGAHRSFVDAYLARAGGRVRLGPGAYQLEGWARIYRQDRGRLLHHPRPAAAALLSFLAQPGIGGAGMSPYDKLLEEARGRRFACVNGWPVEHSPRPPCTASG